MTSEAAGPILVEVAGITKAYGAALPLKLNRLRLGPLDRLTIEGLDPAAAETIVHLVTGAALPDEGRLCVDGRDTRDIATDTEWLASLDRFGIVTGRAVLVGALSIAQNVALPLTLSVDPLADHVSATVDTLADEVGLPRARLEDPASGLRADELIRVHLARALAVRPRMLLVEHPTSRVSDRAARLDLGTTLRRVASARGLGWLVMTDDAVFAGAAGGRRRRLSPSGDLIGGGWWARLFGPGAW